MAWCGQRVFCCEAGALTGWADDGEAAAERLDAVGEAAQSRAACCVGAAGAVVGDLDPQGVVVAGDEHADV